MRLSTRSLYMKVVLASTFFLSLFFLSYGNSFAQQLIKPASGEVGFFIGPFFGDKSQETGIIQNIGFDTSVIFGFRGAINLNPHFALEGVLEFTPADVTMNTTSGRIKLDTVESFLHANLVWHIAELGRFVPYLTGGIGFMHSSSTNSDVDVSETDFSVDFGGGIKYFITDRFVLRFEARNINTQLQDTSDRLNLIQATVGLSFLIF